MRISLLLVPIALAASSEWARSQDPPPSSDLPTVTKPKSGAAKGAKKSTGAEGVAAPDKQDTKPDPDAPDKTDPREPKETPEGEDATASESSGAASTAGPDYTGPAILSRGVSFTGPGLPTNEHFRPYVGLNFYHDSGVAAPYQGPTVKVPNSSFSGADLSFGISGQHYRRSDAVQLDYHGHVYLFGGAAQDHSFAASYTRRLSHRLRFTAGESAGLYSNNYSLLNSVASTDTSIGGIALVVTPNTESFNDRTYYSSTSGNLTFIKNARLSFNIGGSGFLVKRNDGGLISLNGYQTNADVSYRVTKKSTLGPYYAYSRYSYSKTFGDSDIHTVGANYSLALNKRTQLRFRAGISRLETRGLAPVTLSPAVAAILGYSTGIERYYSVSSQPDFAIDFNRNFRRGDFGLSYVRGLSPGNGIILTSQHDSVSANYSYKGIRNYYINFGAGRDTLGAVSQQIGGYSSYFGRLSLSHPLGHDLQGVMNFDYRKLGFSNNVYASNQFRISLGLAFAPGPSPLKFW